MTRLHAAERQRDRARGPQPLAGRWVRWSRPPVRIEMPAPRRARSRRAQCRARGRRRTAAPSPSDCHAGVASDTPIIASAATAKPTGMLPPSPRKMRAGDERLWGRKPRHAPQSAAAATASQVSPCAIPRTVRPPATTAAIVVAAPSMLSKRLNALTTATTQTDRDDEVDGGAEARGSSRGPMRHKPGRERRARPRRARAGVTVRRSSTVPTNHSDDHAERQRDRPLPVAGQRERRREEAQRRPPRRRDTASVRHGPCSRPAGRRTPAGARRGWRSA